MRFWSQGLLLSLIKSSGLFYISPSNFNYWYNFGVLAFYFLFFQIITGVILGMFYSSGIEIAFLSIVNLNNEVYFGWWLRGLHVNGASWFFVVVYLHMFKGLYYGSFMYPRQLLWYSGVTIWILMIPTAFLGYVLPWGQMSYWGAMVITSLVGVIPFIGYEILFLLWGSFSIDAVTLNRFFSLHYTLPFIIFALALLHFFLLHEFGSSNPLGLSSRLDNLTLFPYYALKDFLSIIIVWFFFYYILFLSPDLLNHPDNYNIANSMVTPAHIVPEWYFLPLYAVLRSVTNKLLGFFLIICFVACLYILPLVTRGSLIRSTSFRPYHSWVFWFLCLICVELGIIGALPVMEPYIFLGQLVTAGYFTSILLLYPLANLTEKIMYDLYTWHVFIKWYDGYFTHILWENT